jgi:hypothetical protein
MKKKYPLILVVILIVVVIFGFFYKNYLDHKKNSEVNQNLFTNAKVTNLNELPSPKLPTGFPTEMLYGKNTMLLGVNTSNIPGIGTLYAVSVSSTDDVKTAYDNYLNFLTSLGYKITSKNQAGGIAEIKATNSKREVDFQASEKNKYTELLVSILVKK